MPEGPICRGAPPEVCRLEVPAVRDLSRDPFEACLRDAGAGLGGEPGLPPPFRRRAGSGRVASRRHLPARRRPVRDHDPQRCVLAPDAEVGGRLAGVGVPRLPGQALEAGAPLDRLPVAVQRAGELGGAGCRPVERLPQRGGGLRVETPEVGGLDPSVRRQLDIETVPVDAGDGVQRGLPREIALDVVSVNLFFTSFAKQARRSRKGGFTGCANVFSPIPVTA